MSEYDMLMFLGAFCVVFSLLGSVAGELIMYLLIRFGWINPRTVTVVHVIKREDEE